MPGADTHLDLLLCDLAVEQGLAMPADVAGVLRQHWEGGRGGNLFEQLVLVADLEPAQVARLRAAAEQSVAAAGGSTGAAVARREGIAHSIHVALAEDDPELSRTLVQHGAPPRFPLHEMRDGRYLDFMPIGEGGMGVVYLALDAQLNREVAVKLIRPLQEDQQPVSIDDPLSLRPPAEDSPVASYFHGQSARFLQEAWVTGGLEHPGIVPIYELGRTPSGVPYYTMRFIRGSRTLRDAVDEAAEGTLEARLMLLEPFLRVCDAIAYAHARGIVHRDLKPANVALGEFGEVVVLDWGLAGARGSTGAAGEGWHERLEAFRSAENLETVEGALGTPGYMAPEAALGQVDEVDERSDVYSLGVMLYEILAGRRPFVFRTFYEYATAVAEQSPPSPREVREDVPESLAALCLAAVAREREKRPAGADALARAVRDWQTRSQVEREVEGWLAEARQTMAEIDDLPSEAAIGRLDHVVAACAMIERARPGHEAGAALAAQAVAKRDEAVSRRVHEGRRRALVRVGMLVVMLAGVAAVVVAGVLGRKNKALDVARGRAEGLVTYLVADVRKGLEEIGRLDLLDGVAGQVMAHYEERLAQEDADALDASDRVAFARAVGVLAAVLQQRGRPAEAVAALTRARTLLEALDTQDARILRAELTAQHGAAREAAGDADGARREMRAAIEALSALAAGPKRTFAAAFGLAVAHRRLGTTHLASGSIEEAEQALEASSAAFEAAAAAGVPADRRVDLLRERAVRCREDAAIGRRVGDAERDLVQSRAAAALFEEAFRLSPRDWRITEGVVNTAISLAGVDYEAERFQATADRLREVRPKAERLVGMAPDSVRTRRLLAHVLQSEAYALIALGRLQEALPVQQQAIRVVEETIKLAPEAERLKLVLGGSFHVLGRTYLRGGRHGEAVEAFERSVGLITGAGADAELGAALAQNLILVRSELADALRAAGRLEEERRVRDEALRAFAPFIERHPEDSRGAQLYCSAMRGRVQADVRAGDTAAALEGAAQGLAMVRSQYAATRDLDWRVEEGDLLRLQALARWQARGWRAAVEDFAAAQAAFAEGVDGRTPTRRGLQIRARALEDEALIRRELGQLRRASELLQRAVADRERVVEISKQEAGRGRARLEARARLADVLGQRGRAHAALPLRVAVATALRTAAEASPNDHGARAASAEAARTLAESHLAVGHVKEALELAEAARLEHAWLVARDASNVRWRAGLVADLRVQVQALAAAGRGEDAHAALRRLEELAADGDLAPRLRGALAAAFGGKPADSHGVRRIVASILHARGERSAALAVYRALAEQPARAANVRALRRGAHLAAGLVRDGDTTARAAGLEIVRAELAWWTQRRDALRGDDGDRAALELEGVLERCDDLRRGDAALAPLREDPGFEGLFGD